jgi:hypothetical protein
MVYVVLKQNDLTDSLVTDKMQNSTGSILQDATVNNWPTGPTETNTFDNSLDLLLGSFNSLLHPTSEIPLLNNILHTTLIHDTIQPQVLLLEYSICADHPG